MSVTLTIPTAAPVHRTRRRNDRRRVAALGAADLGWHQQLELVAHRGSDGVWRWLNVRPGDEVLTARQIAELAPYEQVG